MLAKPTILHAQLENTPSFSNEETASSFNNQQVKVEYNPQTIQIVTFQPEGQYIQQHSQCNMSISQQQQSNNENTNTSIAQLKIQMLKHNIQQKPISYSCDSQVLLSFKEKNVLKRKLQELQYQLIEQQLPKQENVYFNENPYKRLKQQQEQENSSSIDFSNQNGQIISYDSCTIKLSELPRRVSLMNQHQHSQISNSNNSNNYIKCNKIDLDFFPNFEEKKPQYIIKNTAEGCVYICQRKGCTYTTLKKAYISKHLQRNHSDKIYHCQVEGCSYQTKTKEYIPVHMKAKHNQQGFRCQVEGCKFSSKNKNEILIHKKINHQMECKSCGKTFQNQTCLESHIQKIHSYN